MKPRKKRTIQLPSTEGIPKDGVLYRAQVMQLFGVSKTKLRDMMIVGEVPSPMTGCAPYKGIRAWEAVKVWAAYYAYYKIESEVTA